MKRMKNLNPYLWKTNTVLLHVVLIGLLYAPPAFSDATESVVTIYAQSERAGSSQGTGFVVGNDGLIATAYHVVQDAIKLEIIDKHFRKLDKLSVEWIDPRRDIAILRAEGAGNLPGLSLSTATVGAQQEVRIAGSPRGLPKQVLFGRITSDGFISSLALSSSSGRRIFAENIDLLPIDITVYGGMSGAPVIVGGRDVIGILSGSYDEGRGIAWVIPSKYVKELSGAPSLNKRPDQIISWPPLSLMSNSWISLKRSYDKRFTSEHIAKLEVLENAFRTLQGQWEERKEERIVVYDDLTLGRCEQTISSEIVLRIDEIDQDAATMNGAQLAHIAKAAEFINSPQPFDHDVLIRQRLGFCNERVFGDKQKSQGTIKTDGGFSLTAKVNSATSSERPKFDTSITVTDCEGNLCSPRTFGEKKTGRLELISENKIRWQNSILSK